MKPNLMAATLVLAISGVACSQPAQSPPAAATTAAPAPEAAAPQKAEPDASGEALAWLNGSWCGGEEGELIEETWFAPKANETIGMSRTTRGGRIVSFEYMRIMDLEGKLTFIGQPSGDAPTSFERSDGGDGWIRFENRKHDYPQRIEYKREGEALLAEIGGPGEGDREEVVSFRYTRCPK